MLLTVFALLNMASASRENNSLAVFHVFFLKFSMSQLPTTTQWESKILQGELPSLKLFPVVEKHLFLLILKEKHSDKNTVKVSTNSILHQEITASSLSLLPPLCFSFLLLSFLPCLSPLPPLSFHFLPALLPSFPS